MLLRRIGAALPAFCISTLAFAQAPPGGGGVGGDSISPFQPIISGPYEVTDAYFGHVTGNAPNPETTNMVRVNDSLYFVYRHNATTGADSIYVRRFDLTRSKFDRAVLVDTSTDEADGTYHSEPTILRDGLGQLHLFVGYAPARYTCMAAAGLAPRYRVIQDLNAGFWGPPACVPSRVGNPWSLPFLADITGVYDDRAAETHFVAQGGGISHLDGVGVGGFPRVYGRIFANGSVNQPYILVNTISQTIPGDPYAAISAIHAKGELVLGREPAGQRSLHLIWNLRNLWNENGAEHQRNYNLYYARSLDAGNNWQNVTGTASFSNLNRNLWGNSRYLAYQGDVDQGSERALGVDSASRPVLIVLRHKPGTGVLLSTGHVDVLATPRPQYDLSWLRWNGSAWVGGVIDGANDYFSARPRVFVDRSNAIWVFVGTIPFGSPRYFVSRDFGQTWSGPTSFLPPNSGALRLYSYADPIDPNVLYIAYQNSGTRRVYFVSLQLTPR
ncbi:MAG: BNR repeat-containing protein [Phycisphaerae bacterium]|nr:BNR repeat-containing protein [Phycisphaerae bacterium]